MNLNKIFILGNVVADPEMRTTTSGQQVTSFRVATNRVWNDPNTKEKREKAEFHSIVAWGRLAEIAGQYLAKGRLVFVEGRLETQSWQDKQGQTKYRTEIITEGLQLGPRPAGGATKPEGGTDSEAARGRPAMGETGPAEPSPATPQARKAEDIPIVEEETPFSTDNKNEDIKPEDIPF